MVDIEKRRKLLIKLQVLKLLQDRGKSRYFLYKQLGMSYQNFSKMVY